MIRKVEQARSAIPTTKVRDEPLRFSFQYFRDDPEMCPGEYDCAYTQKLIERLQALSSWTVTQFTTKTDKGVRNHRIDWDRTARPDGFAHLNQQLRDSDAWQFSVSSNAHGRVHGLLIDSTFYVVWLDYNHALYP